MVCDGYVKYEEAEFSDRFAIIQDFWDKKKKPIKNGRQSAILNLFSAKIVMGYLCVRPDILFFINGSGYTNIKLLKLKNVDIWNCLLPKGNQDIGWHNWAYFQNKKKETFFWNALTSISSLVAIVIKGLIIWDQNVTNS